MYVGAACRLLHLGVGGVQLAVKDIVAYAAVEQKNVLLNYSDVAAQRVKRYIGDIRSVNTDLSAADRIKARYEVADGGLSAAGGTDERQRTAARDFKLHSVKHLG